MAASQRACPLLQPARQRQPAEELAVLTTTSIGNQEADATTLGADHVHTFAISRGQGAGRRCRLVMCDPGVVPIVLAHARALLTSTPAGRTAYLDADLHDVDAILGAPELHTTLDLSRPVAVSLIAILHFIPDDDVLHGIVHRLVDALPSGSYLALTYGTTDFNPDMQKLSDTYRQRGIPNRFRSRAEVERLFADLVLVEPGVQVLHRWRPDGPVPHDVTDAAVSLYGGVARKE